MRHGIYHYSHALTGTLAERLAEQRADVTAASNLGLDCVYMSHLQDIPGTRRLLDHLRSRGMTAWLEDVHPTERAALASHPALQGLAVADDANDLGKHGTREAMYALCAPAEAHGQRRYISIRATEQEPNGWTYGHTEAIGLQVYPLPTEKLLWYWPIMTTARTQADQHGQALWVNAQLHRNADPRNRLPTADEVRAQGWTAAAAGADGLLWYTMLDQLGRATPELLRAVRDVTAELKAGVSGRPLEVALDRHILRARWAGGTRVEIDLQANRVLSLQTGPTPT